MKKIFALLLIVLFPTLIFAQADQAAQNRLLVFRNVTLIDMRSAQPQPNMTVVVSGDRIAAIGKTGKIRVPKGARGY